uniref:Thimet oligopeptidase n=1 Tax=Anthurium amnicola TaxID=1678845 RepID=A0A1D1ZIK0_9ARAE
MSFTIVNTDFFFKIFVYLYADLPGFNVHINLSASEIHKLVDHIISKSKETYDLIASIPLEKVTFSNTISPLAELDADQFPLVQSCVFLKMVSVSDDVRKASAEAERKLDSHFLICRNRQDVYRVIKAFAERGEWLTPEAQRYVEHLIKDFERNGANLNVDKRKEMDHLKSRIDELSLQYIKNLTEDDSFLLFNDSELAGMPPEFIKGLRTDGDGKMKISLRSHHVSPILEHCKVGSTRKIVAAAHGQRCGTENLGILEKLVQLRHRFACLLGYRTFADYAIEPRMARTSVKVFEFLEDISANLTDLATRELNVLKDLKKKEEGDSLFGAEDLRYYMRRAEEQKLDVDLGTVKQFFPVRLVLSGIFKIFQDLLSLQFEEIHDFGTWHDTVRLFSVMDFSSSELLGYFFLDIFYREEKYSQTCVLALQNGCLSSSGKRQIPVALVIGQFPNEVDGKPGLLRFTEVVSFFHEFSHVVHHICNRATFSRFSGLRMDSDYIEIPSQMLENWCYECLSLKQMSGFYQDITKPIKDELCRSLKRRRDSFSGLKMKQEILLCLVDQIIHSGENVDIVELLKHLHPKVLLGIPLLEGTNPASCFPRFAIGYEATCYSYIWSEVFATDIFVSKFQDDLLNRYSGLQFRNKVFAPGGARDPLEILFDYLGREPSIQPFIESKTKNSLWCCT